MVKTRGKKRRIDSSHDDDTKRPARRSARTPSWTPPLEIATSTTRFRNTRPPRVSLSPAQAAGPESPLLELLSDDVLSKCLFGGYINSLDTISKVSCVCKRTRGVAQETVKMLDLRKCTTMKPTHVSNLVSRFQNLSVIDFSYCFHFTGRHLVKLVPVSRTLKTLHLRGSSIVDGDIVGYFSEVQRFLGGPSLLRKLDVSAVTKSGSTRIGDAAVVKIALSCPDLEWLHLAWCTRVTDNAVESLQRLRHLHDLDLSLSGVSAGSCSILSKMSSIKNLDVSATSVGDAGIRILMGEEREEGNSSGEEESKVWLRDDLSQLQVLRTRFNTDLSVKTLQLVTARAPKLKTLDLCYCEALGRETTKAVYRELKKNGTTIIDQHGESSPPAQAAS